MSKTVKGKVLSAKELQESRLRSFREAVFKLIDSGLTEDVFTTLWGEYHEHYCVFDRAYTSSCGSSKSPDRVARMSVSYRGKEYYLCEEHSKEKCSKCGRPAVKQCCHAGQFVCGALLCPDCIHH